MFVGIDSHKDTLAACMVDRAGREVAGACFPNSPSGHGELLEWARALADVTAFGVEGSANLGAGLAQFLLAAGEAVFEVPGALTARERRRLRRPGRSDPGDALAIARVAAREDRLPPVRGRDLAGDLKTLCDYRDQLVRDRGVEINRLHADLAILCPGYAQRTRQLVSDCALEAAGRLLAEQTSVRARIAQAREGARIRQLKLEIKDLEREIAAFVKESATSLVSNVGIGSLLAARILGEVGDPRRYPTAAHFASANGTAPIPVSSGRTDRHRLNRGGNRRLNLALHYMALTQSGCDPRAIAYLERKREEGKSRREALRCLKRRLSDVVYRTLLADLDKETSSVPPQEHLCKVLT